MDLLDFTDLIDLASCGFDLVEQTVFADFFDLDDLIDLNFLNFLSTCSEYSLVFSIFYNFKLYFNSSSYFYCRSIPIRSRRNFDFGGGVHSLTSNYFGSFR